MWFAPAGGDVALVGVAAGLVAEAFLVGHVHELNAELGGHRLAQRVLSEHGVDHLVDRGAHFQLGRVLVAAGQLEDGGLEG